VEQDRGMRKKICTFLTEICKNHGIDELVKALPKASVFLLRNLIMVLGDAKPTDLMSHIFPYIRHEQKIIRTETVRSLCKEGSNETEQAVLQILEQSADNDIKQIILDHVSAKKSRKTLPTLMRISKLPHQTSAIRKSIYQTAAAMGGTEVKLFLQSVLQDSNFLNKFNSEQKEELALVQTLLSRMKP
jgi:protein subunit release factor A